MYLERCGNAIRCFYSHQSIAKELIRFCELNLKAIEQAASRYL
jgi:hypothetical protein